MIPALDSIIQEAIAQRILPGAVVLVAQDGKIQHFAAYGSTMYTDLGSQPVTLETIYDLASLTKIFTATAALRLFDAKLLALDAPVAYYLANFQASSLTVRQLLTHTSGLKVRLSTLCKQSAAEIKATVWAAKAPPDSGESVEYSNCNSLLLGEIVAAIMQQPLDRALKELVCQPLQLQQTLFCPPEALWPSIAPTEWDHTWRERLIQGTVHDESTHALGGVAGHAGLFSVAPDLWTFGQMWLDGGYVTTQKVSLLREETVALATQNQTAHLPRGATSPHCGLGWMLEHPTAMQGLPSTTYGHTGFTGPVVALLPPLRLLVVILSNRTYPLRTVPPNHHALTAKVLRTAHRELT